MATQRGLSQSKETLLQNYNKRLKDDIRSILDNFTEIIKTAKVPRASQRSRYWYFFPLSVSPSCIRVECVLLKASHPPVGLSCLHTRVMSIGYTGFSPQIEDETQVSRATQAEQDHYEMHVRAANIVSKARPLGANDICYQSDGTQFKPLWAVKVVYVSAFTWFYYFCYLREL